MKNLLMWFGAPLQGGEVNIPEISAGTLLTNALNIVYFVMGSVAVIIIILAGYRYMTASGDSSKITKASQAIIYAVVGLVVIVCAFAITNFVAGRI